jgi:alpha-D-ribose 1-methylphosphonate 5-triphosphate diphosphatase
MMWLSDLKIVLPDKILEHGSIRIESGVITEIIETPAPSPIPSLKGLTLIPGLVDLHGDMLERDVLPRPTARFPTEMGLLELDKRLAGCGITTAYAAISFAWQGSDLRRQENAIEMIDKINMMNPQLLVDMKVHARFEVTNPATAPILKGLLESKKIQLVSIMDHTPGQGQYTDVDRYLKFMQKWLNVPDDALGDMQDEIMAKIKEGIEGQAEKSRDWIIIEDVVDVALAFQIPVASHDDDTTQKVQRQAEMGIKISEFPVTMDAAIAAQQANMKVVMGAPNAFRGESTSNNLSAVEAIRAGLVDILATDYYPASMIHTAFKLTNDGVMPLYDSIKLISTNPADVMGLDDRGAIEVGRRADLVLVHEQDDFPRVRGTISNGIPIYWDSHLASLSKLTSMFFLECEV